MIKNVNLDDPRKALDLPPPHGAKSIVGFLFCRHNNMQGETQTNASVEILQGFSILWNEPRSGGNMLFFRSRNRDSLLL
jgi:hypothetical protein